MSLSATLSPAASLARSAAFATCLSALATAALAVPLSPGGFVSRDDLAPEAARAQPGDPAFFGTSTVPAFANESLSADFLFGGALISDYFTITGQLVSFINLTTPQRTVFGYEFGFITDEGTDDFPGIAFPFEAFYGGASVTGFAGYDVEVAVQAVESDDPLPDVIRSDDGDTITFDFRSEGLPNGIPDDGFTLSTNIVGVPIFLAVNAPAFRFDGTGTIDLAVDSTPLTALATGPILYAPAGAPVAPIPLPAGLPLLAAALGALGLARRRA